MPYSLEQIVSFLPILVLCYTISQRFSGVLGETTVEVSVACMLSFSNEDSINVYRFIARVAYRLAQALHINLHELNIGISC